ncbi:MAG: hypothetical protein QOE64_1085 [Frankiales bacterium]|jgi:hypothetical protein|nr:hypothetical protein [Frankiales bacterium]
MRKRSAALILATATMSIALPLNAASATDSSVIVRSVPAAGIGATGIKPMNLNCAVGGSGTGSMTTVSSTGAPSGQGSLRMSVGSNQDTEVGFYKAYAAPLPAAQLTSLSFGILGVSDNDPYFLDLYFDRDGAGAGDAQDLLELVVPNNATWQSINGITTGYDVYLNENTTGNPDSTNTTISQYLAGAGHASAGLVGWYLTNFCSAFANQSVYLDSLTVGDNGADNTTYDFEPASTITVVGAGTINYASTRTLTATLKSGSHPIEGAQLQLWAKKYPATTYSLLTSPVVPLTGSTGVTSVSVKPTVNTAYQFRYPGNEPTNGLANSPVAIVNVATLIGRTLSDTTLTRTQTLVVTGTVKPPKPGTTVYLYRGSVSIAYAKVVSTSTGATYRLTAVISTPGTYSLTVRGAAGTGNSSGTSAPATVTVR